MEIPTSIYGQSFQGSEKEVGSIAADVSMREGGKGGLPIWDEAWGPGEKTQA